MNPDVLNIDSTVNQVGMWQSRFKSRIMEVLKPDKPSDECVSSIMYGNPSNLFPVTSSVVAFLAATSSKAAFSAVDFSAIVFCNYESN